MAILDVSDLCTFDLIRSLWRNRAPALFFSLNGITPPSEPTDTDIINELSIRRNYIDYLNGRCIKTNFSDLTKVDTRLYDRDSYPGHFEEIVDELRKSVKQ